MKAVICAIAKMEDLYIKDWCDYHLSLGFSDIYVYDNNDINYSPSIEECLGNSLNEKVHIIKCPGKINNFQRKTYTNFYKSQNKNFDWCAFIDIDEFITLKDWSNINDFLNDEKFKNAEVIKLQWHMFGDNDEIKQDTNIPIYNRITKEVFPKWRNLQCKSIVKNKLNIIFRSAHHPTYTMGGICKEYYTDGRKCTTNSISVDKRYENAFISHYMTKTLDEFICQKFIRVENNGYDDSSRLSNGKSNKVRFSYYFDVNKKTPEKLQYIKDKLDISL